MRVAAFVLIALSGFLLANCSNAQVTFQKSIVNPGMDNIGDFLMTPDSGYVFVGGSSGNVMLGKTDPEGNTIWIRIFGGNNSEGGYDILQTSDGGFLVASNTNSFGLGDRDALLIKTDSTGILQWSKVIGTPLYDSFFSILETPDGGFMAAGQFNGTSGASFTGYLVKFDAQGDTLWTRGIGGTTGFECFYSLQHTGDGNYILAGEAAYSSHDAYIVKSDSLGIPLWIKTYGGPSIDAFYDVQQTADSGYIATGYTYLGAGQHDLYLVKTDSSGNVDWSKTYGGIGFELGYRVLQTDDGGYFISGLTSLSGAFYDIYYVRTNSLGDTLWTRKIAGSNTSTAGSKVLKTADGGYMIGSNSQFNQPGDWDVSFIKTDSMGISGCNTDHHPISVIDAPTQVNSITSITTSGGVISAHTLLVNTITPPTDTLCISTSVPEIKNRDHLFEIFPNPANGRFFISSSRASDFRILVHDAYGKLVYSETVKDLAAFSTKEVRMNVTKGIYFVKLFFEDAFFSKKIVILNE